MCCGFYFVCLLLFITAGSKSNCPQADTKDETTSKDLAWGKRECLTWSLPWISIGWIRLSQLLTGAECPVDRRPSTATAMWMNHIMTLFWHQATNPVSLCRPLFVDKSQCVSVVHPTGSWLFYRDVVISWRGDFEPCSLGRTIPRSPNPQLTHVGQCATQSHYLLLTTDPKPEYILTEAADWCHCQR